MAYLGKTYNVEEMPQQQEFKPLPAGEYELLVEEVELRQTNNGAGEYLLFKTKVQGPTHQGRVLFDRIMISHSNPMAEEIGLKRLNSYIRAIGLSGANDTDQLVNKLVKAKVKVGTPSEKYPEPGNDITAYMATVSAPMPSPSPSAQPEAKPWENPQQESAQPSSKKPWE
jgi:hypothetical protein